MQDNFSPPPVTPSSFSPYPLVPKNNTMAVTSLILGIVGILLFCLSFVFSIIPLANIICGCLALLAPIGALVTGFIARGQIRTSGEKGDGMATAGMVIGGIELLLIICGVIFALVIALVPALGEIFSSISSGLK